jgi:hypothetical protein
MSHARAELCAKSTSQSQAEFTSAARNASERLTSGLTVSAFANNAETGSTRKNFFG